MADTAQEAVLPRCRAKPLKVVGPVLTFALSEGGVLVHVDEIENGLACRCKCPSCGELLVARQGEERAHCFAHQSGSECVGGYETSLHLAAKKIIAEAKCLFLPALEVTGEATDLSGKKWHVTRRLPEKLVHFDDVYVQEFLGNRVPDLLAKVGEKSLVIEIAVTHKCEPEKIADYTRRGCAAVEVDLSDTRSAWDWGSLRKRLLEEPAGGRWLYSPKTEELKWSAEEKARELAMKADQDSERRKQAAEKKRQKREDANLEKKAERERLLATEQEKTLWERQRNDTPGFMDELKALHAENPKAAPEPNDEAHASEETEGIPEYLNIPVPGELGFRVDRRVWQSAVFEHFVAAKTHDYFTERDVEEWCHANFEQEPKFETLRSSHELLSHEEKLRLPSISNAAQHYIRELANRGVLRWKPDRWYVVIRQSPPPELAALFKRAGRNMVAAKRIKSRAPLD